MAYFGACVLKYAITPGAKLYSESMMHLYFFAKVNINVNFRAFQRCLAGCFRFPILYAFCTLTLETMEIAVTVVHL